MPPLIPHMVLDSRRKEWGLQAPGFKLQLGRASRLISPSQCELYSGAFIPNTHTHTHTHTHTPDAHPASHHMPKHTHTKPTSTYIPIPDTHIRTGNRFSNTLLQTHACLDCAHVHPTYDQHPMQHYTLNTYTQHMQHTPKHSTTLANHSLPI